MSNHPSRYWIDQLDLKPHPEGGFYKENFQSTNTYPSGEADSRPLYSSIYFMVTKESFSAFHRLKSDEMWHFYNGHILDLYLIYPDGTFENKRLGLSPEEQVFPQVLIPGGTWFAAALTAGDFTLCGCSLSPGFNYRDFEMGERRHLASKFPEHAALISKLTRERR